MIVWALQQYKNVVILVFYLFLIYTIFLDVIILVIKSIQQFEGHMTKNEDSTCFVEENFENNYKLGLIFQKYYSQLLSKMGARFI